MFIVFRFCLLASLESLFLEFYFLGSNFLDLLKSLKKYIPKVVLFVRFIRCNEPFNCFSAVQLIRLRRQYLLCRCYKCAIKLVCCGKIGFNRNSTSRHELFWQHMPLCHSMANKKRKGECTFNGNSFEN